MNRYPAEAFSVPAPLVVIQGLGLNGVPEGSTPVATPPEPPRDASISLKPIEDSDNPLHSTYYTANTVKRALPAVTAASGLELVALFKAHDVTQRSFDASSFNVRFVDEFHLPPIKHQKRVPSEVSVSDSPTEHTGSSPLSPFNPDSTVDKQAVLPLYWFQKYHSLHPAVFISVHELEADAKSPEDIQGADSMLVAELLAQKEQLFRRGIKFVSIVVSSESEDTNPDLIARVENIRKLTGLPSRTGLLFLPAGTQREMDSFLGGVLQLLTTWTNDFYTALDRRIRKRMARQPVYLAEAWDARYSLKLGYMAQVRKSHEAAVKSLEHAYEKLVEVLRGTQLSSPNWNDVRALLDMCDLQIVRLYLSLNKANTAYKKFDIHLQIVTGLLFEKGIPADSYSTLSWLSLQYAWLAQLVEKAPSSVVPTDRSLQPFFDAKGKIVATASTESMPHGGYIYLHSVGLLRQRKRAALGYVQTEDSVNDPYMTLEITEELAFDYGKNIIEYLESAIEVFGRGKKSKFNRAESFIYFQLGEEYFLRKNYGLSANNYIVALSIIRNEHWNMMLSVALYRLYLCSIEFGNFEDAVSYLLEIGTIDAKLLDPQVRELINGKDMPTKVENVNFKADLSRSLFKGTALFKKPSHELSERSEFQLALHPTLNDLIPKCNVSSVTLEFSGDLPTYVIRHNPELPVHNLVLIDAETGETEVEANLEMANTKVFQLSLLPKAIGEYRCVGVHVTAACDQFSFSCNVPLPSSQFQERHFWYEGESLTKTVVRSTDPTGVKVIPRHPKVSVALEYAKKCFAGEYYVVTATLENNDFEEVGVELEATANTSSLPHLSTYWGDSKEASASGTMGVGSKHTYTLVVHVPPNAMEGRERDRVAITLKYTYFVGNDRTIPVSSRKALNVPLSNAFDCALEIMPRVWRAGIPSPFVVDTEKPINAIPVHSRLWCANLDLKYNGENPVEIVSAKLEVFSITDGISCEVVREHKYPVSVSGETQLQFHFVSEGIDGHSKRNVQLEARLVFEWASDSATNVTNAFCSAPWNLTLPHSDPRVVLDVGESDNGHELTYMIENPTPRIFQFSTSLTDNSNFEIHGLKNQTFSVLPFMRQEIIFGAVAKGEGWLKLPEFKVYDLNYKVNLPTLVATPGAKSENGDIYLLT